MFRKNKERLELKSFFAECNLCGGSEVREFDMYTIVGNNDKKALGYCNRVDKDNNDCHGIMEFKEMKG